MRATVKTGGTASTLSARYLVGCDGGSSAVRRQLGIKLQGEANLLQLRQALYRCDDLFERIPIGKGRHYHVADARDLPDRAGFTRHFTLHAVVESDADMAAMFEKAVALRVDYQMLYVGKWQQNLLLADSYQQGRVFLAGDAVHLVIPTGGLGMNSGVGDAIDLSWKLAATLEGWGGPHLLRSYEIERRQIGARNVEASRQASRGRRAWRAAWRPDIRDDTPAGAEARANLARIANVEQRKSNEMIGAELGYRYRHSPLIWPEDSEGPADDLCATCRPAGRARGCRMSGCATAARCTIVSATATPCCGLPARDPMRRRWRKRLPPSRPLRHPRCARVSSARHLRL